MSLYNAFFLRVTVFYFHFLLLLIFCSSFPKQICDILGKSCGEKGCMESTEPDNFHGLFQHRSTVVLCIHPCLSLFAAFRVHESCQECYELRGNAHMKRADANPL